MSKTVQYAIRALLYVHNQNNADVRILSVHEIADNIGSPKPFTAKILQTLTKKHILGSSKGPGGGFFSNELTGQATLYDIIGFHEGEDYHATCILGLPQCSDSKPCPIHFQYKLHRCKLNDMFKDNTIQQLADELSQGKDQFQLL